MYRAQVEGKNWKKLFSKIQLLKTRYKGVWCSRLLDADISSKFRALQFFIHLTNLLVYQNRDMPKGKYIQEYSVAS
jgi:hypothetical protein